MSTTKILIADDHVMMREGLRKLLESQPGLQVVAEAGDGRTAVELVERMKPDVVIMDVAMPDLNGVEATRQIVRGPASSKVIALSAHGSGRFVTEILKAGAVGYVLKQGGFSELVHAIESVTTGKAYLSPDVSQAVLDGLTSGETEDAPVPAAKLTAREREILQLMAEGKSTQTIGSDLGVSPKTVATHRTNIMQKLGLRNVAQLVQYAIREGVIAVE